MTSTSRFQKLFEGAWQRVLILIDQNVQNQREPKINDTLNHDKCKCPAA